MGLVETGGGLGKFCESINIKYDMEKIVILMTSFYMKNIEMDVIKTLTLR